MAVHKCKSKKTANAYAKRMRNKGYNVSVYKRKTGYGVSVTR